MMRLRGMLWPVATLLLATLLIARLAPLGESGPAAVATRALPPEQGSPKAADRVEVVVPSAAGEDAATRVFDCDPVPDPTVAMDGGGLDYLESVAGLLAAATDAEHLLVAALLAADSPPAESDRLMSAALQADPDNPLVLWNALHHCRGKTEATLCSGGLLERQAQAVDGDNGALWSRLAAYRYERGDLTGALAALERVATAPDFDLYFFDHVRLFERGLAAASDRSGSERSVHAIGIAAAMTGDEFRISGYCRSMAAGTTTRAFEWRRACLHAGQRLEQDSGTVLGTLIGTALQKAMLDLDGNDEAAAVVAERDESLRRRFQGLASADVNLLLATDNAVQADYVDVADAHGEMAALRFVVAEVDRLAAVPGYDPCGFPATPGL